MSLEVYKDEQTVEQRNESSYSLKTLTKKKKMHLTAFLGLSLILQRKIILQEDKIETLKTFF